MEKQRVCAALMPNTDWQKKGSLAVRSYWILKSAWIPAQKSNKINSTVWALWIDGNLMDLQMGAQIGFREREKRKTKPEGALTWEHE